MSTYGAFMDPQKLRDDSATIVEESSMFGDRKTYLSRNSPVREDEGEDEEYTDDDGVEEDSEEGAAQDKRHT